VSLLEGSLLEGSLPERQMTGAAAWSHLTFRRRWPSTSQHHAHELEMAMPTNSSTISTPVHTTIGSPVGELTLVGQDGRLTGVYFPHHWYRPDPATFGPLCDTGFGEARRQFAEYFAGQRERFDLPVEARGDEFQHRVWDRVAAIPYGHTVTYGELARELAGELAGERGGQVLARDVGAAVGRNPLSVVVPCHRVVGKDGRLTGYAGGLARKRFLLDLEETAGRRPARLF
jgi:methylated-DNA-[protein]-cysteine S-methyltransferase